MQSIIVFSDRCTLKSVQINSNDVRVINRHSVALVIANMFSQIPNDLLSKSDIIDIYNRLYPCTQVDDTIKLQHIKNIHKQ